jgi:Cu/Ag efflux pump CusA
MMVFGISKFPHMPVDVFPEFAPVRVEVQTATNGLSAEEAGVVRHSAARAGAQWR